MENQMAKHRFEKQMKNGIENKMENKMEMAKHRCEKKWSIK